MRKRKKQQQKNKKVSKVKKETEEKLATVSEKSCSKESEEDGE